MAIQTNEKEFKGKTLQEYLEWKYPTKEDKESVKKIDIFNIQLKLKEEIGRILGGRELDLQEFVGLKDLSISGSYLISPLIKLNVNNCSSLKELDCSANNLTSIDFLNQLPNPENLRELLVYNNNIEPTNIEVFSKFVNLEELRIGTMRVDAGKHNKFYGSFKS